MPGWPPSTRLIGTRIPRIDGLAKASGTIKYPSDVRPEGRFAPASARIRPAHRSKKRGHPCPSTGICGMSAS